MIQAPPTPPARQGHAGLHSSTAAFLRSDCQTPLSSFVVHFPGVAEQTPSLLRSALLRSSALDRSLLHDSEK